MSESTSESTAESAAESTAVPAPDTLLGTLDELLRRPDRIAERLDGRAIPRFIVGGIVCCVLYGAAAGMFQGGEQIVMAALKAPLVMFVSLLLCAPSFYVFSALTGTEVTPRWTWISIFGFGAVLGLMLVALLPVAWLFSVSSRTLVFPVILHSGIWLTALTLGQRFLKAVYASRGGNLPSAWILLFLLVSFQVASQMRPMLWSEESADFFEPRRMFFMEHFSLIIEGEGPTLEEEPSRGSEEPAS